MVSVLEPLSNTGWFGQIDDFRYLSVEVTDRNFMQSFHRCGDVVGLALRTRLEIRRRGAISTVFPLRSHPANGWSMDQPLFAPFGAAAIDALRFKNRTISALNPGRPAGTSAAFEVAARPARVANSTTMKARPNTPIGVDLLLRCWAGKSGNGDS